MPDLLAPARALSACERRAACSDAERRAALWLQDEVTRRGHEAWVEPLWLRPQAAGSLMAHAAVGVAGSVLSVGLPAAGTVLAALAAASLAVEAAGRTGPLRVPFPRRATQVVVTEPDEPELVQLVLCASFEAPRRRLPGPGRLVWLAIAALVIAATAGARVAGVDAGWLGLVQFVPTVVLLVALAAGADAALAGPSADEVPAGAAVALALHDGLVARPPAELSATLLLGSEQARGAFLREEALDPQRAVLLELARDDADPPRLRTSHPQLRAAAALAGVAGRARPVRRDGLPAARLSCTPATARASYDAALAFVDALDEALEARQPSREAASSAK